MRYRRTLTLLSTVSAICFIYGLGLLFVQQELSFIALGLVILSVLGLGVVIQRCNKKSNTRSSRIQWSRISILTGIVILFFGLFGAINYFAYKSDIRWDLTAHKQHTLASSTTQLITDFDQDITLTVLHVGTPAKYINDMLSEYKRLSNEYITFEVIDPLLDIGYAAQFGNVITGKEKKLIAETGGVDGQRSDFDFTKTELTEDIINNAITRILRPSRKVYFLTGHNEFRMDNEDDTGLTKLVSLLDDNNIHSEELFLKTNKIIPKDCDALIIAGPKDALAEEDELIIHEYMKVGGDVLFLVEHSLVTTPDKPLTDAQLKLNPGLNRILNKWGLKVYADVVVDLSSHAGQDVGSPATKNYMPHPSIVKGLDYTFYVRPRSIGLAPHKRESIRLAPILKTASKKNSWGESNRELKIKFNELEDRKGPVAFAYIGWEAKVEGELSDTRFIVFTDADFMTNVYVDQLSNGQMALNVINWLVESDYKIYADTKKVEIQELNLNSQQKRIIISVLVAMSLSILFAGLIVWMRSRLSNHEMD
ncbi:MAG: ABC-type uncharacterized transport system involved in gliding motility auxiliary subunit [Candidatus Omnitrophota bacterium]|jgi:ABC-type uncharacterized transport system involved in gliding motility auxiliary subunit